MEKKLIALVFVALLGGLGGGYGLGYVIYQPEIQNLQNDLNNLNDRFDSINSTLRNTQSSVTSLQNELSTLNSEVSNLNSTLEEMENKTWHFVTNFTLSTDEPISELFFVQGEKWRIRWEPQWLTGSWYGFIIWDENGYAIDYVNPSTILMFYPDANGIHYVPHGKGSYYIEWLSGPDVKFTIESYH